MSPKAFHVRIGLLVWCKIGWRQLDFSWTYPFTGRYSKESEHIQIIIWDRVRGRRRTGCRSLYQRAERLEELEGIYVGLVTENEREDPRESCT